MNSAQLPLSLYVHLPWCVRKCPYCDFNSYTAGIDAPRARYLRALQADLALEARRVPGRELVSVFLGGGTPSLFTPDEIAQLLDSIARQFRLASGVEITLEANPGSVECGDPAGYRAAGVNRLSLGAQSFDDTMLETLGRVHRAADIVRAFADVRSAGFANINLDLMYALPGQDAAQAIVDIEKATALRPEHLSWYQLTLEPNTVFHARPPAGLPDEDGAFEIQEQGRGRLGALGYEQYEVSAYARDGRRSVHNLNYWLFGDYLGVGAGAHGKITLETGLRRYRKPANPLSYMEAIESGRFAVELEERSAEERLFEFMLNALRLTGGFEEEVFVERAGLGVEYLHERLAPVIAKGLIAETGPGEWRPTPRGGQFLNNLQAEFLPR